MSLGTNIIIEARATMNDSIDDISTDKDRLQDTSELSENEIDHILTSTSASDALSRSNITQTRIDFQLSTRKDDVKFFLYYDAK